MALLDLVIIGAGPAGMTAAIYAKRKGLSIQVVADSLGGQVSKTGNVENYPGYGSIPGPRLVSIIKKQLEELKVDIRLSRVLKLERAGPGFRVTTSDGHVFDSKAVIVASGSRWKELDVPGEREFQNRGVSNCTTCDAPLFAGVDVAVVGGGNAAGEAVLDLLNLASKIYLVVRSSIRADKIIVDRILESGKVTVLTGYTVERINGGDFVESIDIVSKGGEHKTLKVGGVFVDVGFLPNVAFAHGLVKLNGAGEIIIDDYCCTSVRGIFAAGDVTDVPQKQIVVAAGEGAKAAMAAYTYITTLK
ncbi:MAG TPA: FAD-dependent oxidoreductase, partial [Methanocella sp.]|nr:FAD-dependent oxidoreductase [Methanocella sp.]